MRTAGLLINPAKLAERPDAPAMVLEAIDALQARGTRVVVNRDAAGIVGVEGLAATEETLSSEPGLLIVLGGDGTILHGARTAGGRVPLLGVRVGGFGFLAELNLEDLRGAIDRIAAGDYEVEERMMLAAGVERGGTVRETYLGLNDAVVTGSGVARVLRLSAFVNDELLATYPADGIIVSTPTGSTAYALSAGGPIVHPRVGVLVITPITPHAFNARSVIVDRDARVTIECAATTRGQSAHLTVDGQVGRRIDPGERVVVRRAEETTKLVRLTRTSFYGILRNKLGWGGR